MKQEGCELGVDGGAGGNAGEGKARKTPGTSGQTGSALHSLGHKEQDLEPQILVPMATAHSHSLPRRSWDPDAAQRPARQGRGARWRGEPSPRGCEVGVRRHCCSPATAPKGMLGHPASGPHPQKPPPPPQPPGRRASPGALLPRPRWPLSQAGVGAHRPGAHAG